MLLYVCSNLSHFFWKNHRHHHHNHDDDNCRPVVLSSLPRPYYYCDFFYDDCYYFMNVDDYVCMYGMQFTSTFFFLDARSTFLVFFGLSLLVVVSEFCKKNSFCFIEFFFVKSYILVIIFSFLMSSFFIHIAFIDDDPFCWSNCFLVVCGSLGFFIIITIHTHTFFDWLIRLIIIESHHWFLNLREKKLYLMIVLVHFNFNYKIFHLWNNNNYTHTHTHLYNRLTNHNHYHQWLNRIKIGRKKAIR